MYRQMEDSIFIGILSSRIDFIYYNRAAVGELEGPEPLDFNAPRLSAIGTEGSGAKPGGNQRAADGAQVAPSEARLSGLVI